MKGRTLHRDSASADICKEFTCFRADCLFVGIFIRCSDELALQFSLASASSGPVPELPASRATHAPAQTYTPAFKNEIRHRKKSQLICANGFWVSGRIRHYGVPAPRCWLALDPG